MIGKRIFLKIQDKLPLLPYICYAVDDGYEYYICLTEYKPKFRISIGMSNTIVTVY